MAKQDNKLSDSPLLSTLVSWVEKKDTEHLRDFFPLGAYSTWERVRGGKFKEAPYIIQVVFAADGPRVVSRKSNLDERRGAIQAILADLYLHPGLNVRFEPDCRRHRKDNAYSCVEYHQKRLKKIPVSELKNALREFQSDFGAAAPGCPFPFSWILNDENPVAKEMDELNKRILQIETEELRLASSVASVKELDGLIAEEDMLEWKRRDLKWADDLARAVGERKRHYVLDVCTRLLWMMKWARGKPGRHPKEFNVFVYHVIKECTSWKFDWKRRAAGLSDPYKYRRDDQHRLETEWKLVLFLMLDTHVHQHKLPELARFISIHRKEPAATALRKMQAWLLNIRKNFPPMHGWTMNKGGVPRPKTGFRKLTVGADGSLKGVSL
jgi:hypothetical protein